MEIVDVGSLKVNEMKLLQLIQARPLIWDSTVEGYRKKERKIPTWEEIYRELNSNYDMLSDKDKKLYGLKVTKRWTHLRDMWQKEYKRLKTPEAEENGDKESPRFHRMKFLLRVYENKFNKQQNQANSVDEDEDTQINSTINEFEHRDLRSAQRYSSQASPEYLDENEQSCSNDNYSEQEKPSSSPLLLTIKKDLVNLVPNDLFATPINPIVSSLPQHNQYEPQCKSQIYPIVQTEELKTGSPKKKRALESEENMDEESQKNFFEFLKPLTKDFNKSQMLNFSSKVLQLVIEIKNEQN